jgi:hypothetical protein
LRLGTRRVHKSVGQHKPLWLVVTQRNADIYWIICVYFVRPCPMLPYRYLPGGLGVPSSNLGAPTNKLNNLVYVFSRSASQNLGLGSGWETEREIGE